MLLLKFPVLSKKFDIFKSLSKKFDIYSKILFRDAENFFRHQYELVLRYQMQVSNYFVKFFYSVGTFLFMRCWFLQFFVSLLMKLSNLKF